MDHLKKNLPAQAGEGSPESAARVLPAGLGAGFYRVSVVTEGCLHGFVFCQLGAQAEAMVCAATEVP